VVLSSIKYGREDIMAEEISTWFKETKLGEMCSSETHCKDCEPNGDCDPCNTIDGRFMDVVNEYASTCDNCGELTSHDILCADPETQLGYCPDCIDKSNPHKRGAGNLF
jgi:hypothetical protein